MNRRADCPVAGVPVASRYPATGVEPSAVIDRHRSPPFQRFLELGGEPMRQKMEAACANQMRNILTKMPLFDGIGEHFLEV